MRKEKGITLIALVVTIVVLLIIAGVSIGLLLGENGIINKAKESREKTEIAGEQEKINLAVMAVKANNEGGGVTEDNLKPELDKNIGEGKYIFGDAEEENAIKIIYTESQRSYTVNGTGEIVDSGTNEDLENALGELQNKYNELLAQNKELQDKLEELVNKNEQLQNKIDSLQEMLDNITSGDSELEAIINELEKQLEDLQSKYDTLEVIKKQLEDKVAQLEREKSDLNTENSRLQEELNNIQNQNTELNTLNELLQEQLETLQNEYNKLEETNRQLQERIEQLETENEQLQQDKENIQKELDELQNEYNELEQSNTELQNKLDELQKNYDNLNETNKNIQNQLNTIQEILSQTTAESEHLLTGYKAYSKGKMILGTMIDNGKINKRLDAGESYTIPKGYHNGSGTIIANSLESQTQGTATADNIASGKTAWVNGQKITGNGKDVNDSYDNGYNEGNIAGKGQIETKTVTATCGNFGNVNTYGYSRSVAVAVPQIEGKTLITYAIQSIYIYNSNGAFGNGTFRTTLSGNTLYVYSSDCVWKEGGVSVTATVIFIYA